MPIDESTPNIDFTALEEAIKAEMALRFPEMTNKETKDVAQSVIQNVIDSSEAWSGFINTSGLSINPVTGETVNQPATTPATTTPTTSTTDAAKAAADKAAADKAAAEKAAAEAKAKLEASKKGPAWILNKEGTAYIQPPMPTDGKDYTWDDAKGWVVTPDLNNKNKNPGKAWKWNNNVGEWTQPAKPEDGKKYTWDDNAGWQVIEEPKKSETQPGKAWIQDANGKWVQPAKPTDGKTYTWDDEKGWVASVIDPTSKKQPGTAWSWNAKLGEWIQPPMPQDGKTYTWDDNAGWVAQSAPAGGGGTGGGSTGGGGGAGAGGGAGGGAGAGGGTGGTGTTTDSETMAKREAIGKILQDRFAKYGISTLSNKIMELARAGSTEATITLELQNTEEYQMRFAANADRIKKGLTVLTPAEYLSAEDAYRQTLRAYGLNQFDNDTYVRQFIANDVSAAELSNRVSIAVQRVQNADPTITQTLRDFYGIGQADMVGYILDPNQQLPKIQQQIASAEIGAAARVQGLEAGVSVSEQLARQGISQAEAQKGYATIADILPTAEKLSSIYGATLPGYGQSEAEQEVFNTLASAQRKRRALTARETATFSGSAGTGRGSLGSVTTGQI